MSCQLPFVQFVQFGEMLKPDMSGVQIMYILKTHCMNHITFMKSLEEKKYPTVDLKYKSLGYIATCCLLC